MKPKNLILLIVLVLTMANNVFSRAEEVEDKTLSPYFFVQSDDSSVDQLPLKSTQADVNIAGVIADVLVTQVYKNEGNKPLEAIYIFPASTRAAVYGMKMTIGERVITAKIEKRQEARKQYEKAKEEGKSASLLEQQRPNVFQMNVANILPGDVIKVELRYTELLVPADGVYEFVYPTVVGPRYSNLPEETAPPSENWVQNPYLHEGKAPAYTFNAAVNLATGLPIQEISCPSHKVNIKYKEKSFANITLDDTEKYGGNRDFIVKYRLSGGQIESGLLLYEGEKENFFVLMVQPPKRVIEAEIPSREYIFIVDVSGSMHGFPLDISKKLLKDLISALRPQEKFNVLLFSGGSEVLAEQSMPATQENIRRAIQVIENQRGGGGTELLPALQRAITLPKAEGFSRTVVVVTDGYVRVEKEAFDLIRNKLGEANLFAFGIGSSVNRYLIEGMARVGMGEPFVITKPSEAPAKAENFRTLIQHPVLTQIKADFGGFDTYDVEPPHIPDVLAERPVIVFGKWRGKPDGKIKVNGITGKGKFEEQIDVSTVKPLDNNRVLRYLWARHRVALLVDYNKLSPDDERVKQVTNLGLTYNLLTPYTSFVAIDSQVRLKDGKAVSVKQPLPLPEGVSDFAVSGQLKGLGTVTSRMPTHAFKMNIKEEAKSLAKDEAAEFEPKPPVPSDTVRGVVKLQSVIVSAEISEQSARKTIENILVLIEGCYNQGLKNNPGLQGKVVLKITIEDSGAVKSIIIDSSELNDRETEECILEHLEKVNFPALKQETTINVTLEFNRKS